MKKSTGLLERKKVLRSIKEMPERFSADDVMERILFLQAIEEGTSELDAGKGVPLAEAKRRHKAWLK